jgi:hypothetical protein
MPYARHLAIMSCMAGFASLGVPRPAIAQVEAGQRTASISGGVLASATGGVSAGPLVSARVDQVLPGRWLLVEGELSYAAVDRGPFVAHLGGIGAQLQAQLPFERVRPFAGLGAGVAGRLQRSGGLYENWDGMISVSGGIRLALPAAFLARVEVRGRYSPGIAGYTGEITVGFGRQLR